MDKKIKDFFSGAFLKVKEFNLDNFINSLGDINEVSSFEILDKINLLNKRDRDKVLNNSLIKDKLRLGLLKESRENQWYYYREILSKINIKEFLSLYDAPFLNEYFTIHGGESLYRFWASMCEKNINTVVSLVIDDDNMLENFLGQSNNFESLFENLDYELLIKLLYKLQDKNSDLNYDFLFYISKENQYLLLKDDKINDNTLVHLINGFYCEVKINFFKNDSRALHLYDKFNISSFAKVGVVFNDNILKKKDFFELLKDISLINFRINVNNIERYNNPSIIEQRVDEYYNEMLSLYLNEYDMFKPYKDILDNPSLIVNSGKQVSYLFHFDIIDKLTFSLRQDETGKYYFENIDELEVFLKEETSKKLSEIIIDSLFKDNIYNIWLNIKEMVRYNDGLDVSDKVLNEDKALFYNLIINFDKISNIDKIKFYNSFKDKNINLMFYEDLRKVKDYAYDKIKEQLFCINKCSDIMAENSTDVSGVKVYDLRDNQYKMLVRTQSQHREESHYPRNCYSIISDENTSVFGSDNYSLFLYGYNGFDNDTVLHMFEQDSFSSGFREQSSRFVNRIMTIDELVKASYSYSEIQLINKKIEGTKYKYSVNKPDFIVVFGNVRSMHIAEAKRLNIPIVMIKRRKLDKKIDIGFDENLDAYVNNIYTENEHRMRR